MIARWVVANGGTVEFRVLGALEARRSGTAVPLGSAQKPRLVLAALLSQADRAVPLDRLISAVWAGQPPASARQNVQHYIHQLRAVLGRERISRQPDGYLIRAGDGLDAARFRRLAARGAADLDNGDAVRAAGRLRSALRLWRGTAYAEFLDCPALADESARLEDLRLTVSEQWADAELRLGRYGAPVEELTELARVHPYREGLRGRLMRALYGAGRQADALQLFRETRTLMAEELGIEPGPQLQRLHEQMLRGDARLAPQPAGRSSDVAATDPARPGRTTAPRGLPVDLLGFTGRDDALRALDEMLPPDRHDAAGPVVIAVIVGTAGVGKTALAVHWAHRVVDRFPDGQLYVDLRGSGRGLPVRPVDALTALLGAVGVPPEYVPRDVAAAAARYRSHIAGRRMLIMLDDADSSAQVRPLMAGSPSCLVLITSRDRLTGLVAHDGARRVELDALSPRELVR